MPYERCFSALYRVVNPGWSGRVVLDRDLRSECSVCRRRRRVWRLLFFGERWSSQRAASELDPYGILIAEPRQLLLLPHDKAIVCGPSTTWQLPAGWSEKKSIGQGSQKKQVLLASVG